MKVSWLLLGPDVGDPRIYLHVIFKIVKSKAMDTEYVLTWVLVKTLL